jgi:hypothetical protein
MISAWWLLVVMCVMLLVMVYHSIVAYNQGVWDGAFNQFLPRVQKQMLIYDEERALRILGSRHDGQTAEETHFF